MKSAPMSIQQKFEQLSQQGSSYHDEMSMESYLNVLLVLPNATSTSSSTLDHSRKADTSRKNLSSPSSMMGKGIIHDISVETSKFSNGNVPSNLDSVRLMQCVYYLKRYGSAELLVRFWLRHNLLEDACRFVVLHNIPPSSPLLQDVIHHCLSHNSMVFLQEAFKRIDPSLRGLSREYLISICKYLNEKSAFLVLLDFLKFMNDFVRAGLICVRLFLRSHKKGTNEFSVQISYLEEAKLQFSEAIANTSSAIFPNEEIPIESNDDSWPSLMSEPEIARYIKIIGLQLQVTKFFQANNVAPPNLSSGKGVNTKVSSPLPKHSIDLPKDTGTSPATLFGSAQERAAIAELLLSLYNYELPFQIIQDFRLPITPIYSNALVSISQRKQLNKINDFLRYIKGTISDSDWDMVLLAAINSLADEVHDLKTAEKLISKLTDDCNKAISYIRCHKLKAAYLLAVKGNQRQLIEQIRDEAQRIGSMTEYELCQKYLFQTKQ